MKARGNYDIDLVRKITKLYKENKENKGYNLEKEEFIGNIEHTMGVIADEIREIMMSVQDIRARNELNTLNYQDLSDERITYEVYAERTNEDLKKAEGMAIYTEKKIKELEPAMEMMKILINKAREGEIEWKCNNIAECQREQNKQEEKISYHTISQKICTRKCEICKKKEEEEMKRETPDEQTIWKYCLEECVWCNKIRKIEKKKIEREASKIYYSEQVLPTQITDNDEKLERIKKQQPTKQVDMPVIATAKRQTVMPIIATTKGDVETQLIATTKGQVMVVNRNESEPLLVSTRVESENETIATNDKYFEVTLTANETDGEDIYIIDALVKNFRQMFPPSYRANAWVYGIEYTEGIPQLHGLIRYDEKNKYRITPKSTHIKNIIVSQYTGTKEERMYRVENLTKYEDKKYKTVKSKVEERYRFVTKQGKVTGDTIDRFL